MSATITSSNPALTPASPNHVEEWQAAREARTIVHEPLYRATPHVTFGRSGTRRGTLRYFFKTATDAASCWTMHNEEAVLTLSADLSNTSVALRYVVTGGDVIQTLDPETRLAFIVEVPYQEVPA